MSVLRGIVIEVEVGVEINFIGIKGFGIFGIRSFLILVIVGIIEVVVRLVVR